MACCSDCAQKGLGDARCPTGQFYYPDAGECMFPQGHAALVAAKASLRAAEGLAPLHQKISWSPTRFAGLGDPDPSTVAAAGPAPVVQNAGALLRVYDVFALGIGGYFLYRGDGKTGGVLAGLAVLDIVGRYMNPTYDAAAAGIPFIGQKVV